MEKESSTAAYDDVFGGPPRFSAPFASRLGDYSEIFGGLASSCSIPVLDLPPALDLFDAPRSSVLDYFEIFGGFDGGDIAPTYEELVAEQERVEVLPSSNGRSPNEAELGQQTTDISEFSPACSNRSHVACLAKDQIASNDHHLNDSHKTNQGNAEDATNEAAQNAQPHVVSGFTSDIERSDDPRNEATIDHSHNAGLNGTPNEATIDHSHSAGLNGRLNDEKQGQTYSRSSSEASSKSSGNCLKSDQKQFARCPTSVDGPAYLKHHSRSSSSHSTSSGDTYYPDFTYLTVSDISLRTQPLQVPPPTRPPPKFANNQDITKMEIRANSETDLDEASLSKHVPNHQKHSGSDAPKRRAPRVPVKESSFFFDVEVDASSAASAMKEAMEQAQARLKSAKESMERNRDNLKSRKKLGHKEGSKCEEGKEAANQKIIMKENKKKNEFSVEDKQKARGAAKVAPDHEENDRRVVSDELNGFRSSLPSYELNDRTGEWKTDKQFYELVHNENFADKIPKETIEVNKERENESKVADLSYEFERKGYAWEVNGTCEKEEHAKILKFGDTTTLPEEKNVNKFEEVYDSYQPVEDQSKLGQTLEAHISEEEVKKPNIGEDSPACFISACSFEVASKNKERESKLGDTKEVSECDGGVELNKNYPTCQPHSSENRLEIANTTGIEVDNNESKTPYASGTWEAPEEVEAAPDLSHCENSEKIRENSTAKWYQEEIPEEHKASEGGTRSRENNITEAVKEDDYEENKAREAQIGCQQDEIEQTAAQVPCELENSVMLTVALPVHKKSENQSIREVHLNMDVKEKYNILNVAQEVFQRVVSKDAAEREKERRIGRERELEEREKERRVQRERELEEREKERRIEREKELEKERKLEEEREREKEREKDRVAVERATREARERAIAEARERAERIAVEKITAEARQRAFTEAREKAEKASAEALEKSLADKASREARLRAERVAVERVTAEARDRAAEKAAADARERVEKLNAASSRAKMRRDNEAEEHSRAGEKGDSGTRVKPSFSGTQDNSKSEVGEGDSPLRCKARLERHQRTVERAAKALAEKNMRDILAQKEQAERNRLAETLDADVRRWSTGKEGNLRALLSTLQYILGAESGWQPIPLTDVITAVAVKKAYRKATLCVHPDKLQQRGASIQQKYICEKVFDLLKDAWNRFNSEER